VLASTMTTVLVFLPVAFVEEEAGQLYSDIAIAISAAILASMLVAISVLPTAAARLRLEANPLSASSLGKAISARRIGARASAFTLDGVHWLLASQRRRLGCIAIISLISIAVIAFLTPQAEYLPEGEEPKVFASMNAP